MRRAPETRASSAGNTHAGTLLGVLLLGVGAITALWLFRGAVDLARAPGWFYQAVNKGSFDMLLVAASIAALPWLARASFRLAGSRPWSAAGCIVLGSVLLQIATGLVARHQVRGWTERFFVGHGEFTWRARELPDALAALRNYERLAAERQLGLYGPSKPPGTYAVYLALDRSSRLRPVELAMAPLAEIVARDPAVPPAHRTLFAWTIFVLGACAALTALPLFGLARVLFGPHAGDHARVFTYPAWLFASAPVVNVITVHLDGSVFPLLSAASTAACAWGAAASRPGRAALAAFGGGLLGVLAVYCSYGNLPILGVGLVVLLALGFERRTRVLAPLLGLFGGSSFGLAVLCFALDWQPVEGYLRGVNYHRAWRPNLPSVWRYGLAFAEFALFAGPPLIIAFLASTLQGGLFAGGAAVERARRQAWPAAPYASWALSFATLGLIIVISLALGTPEAARLWMFILPWVCCAASMGLARPALAPAFHALLLAQTALTLFVKNYLVW